MGLRVQTQNITQIIARIRVYECGYINILKVAKPAQIKTNKTKKNNKKKKEIKIEYEIKRKRIAIIIS